MDIALPIITFVIGFLFGSIPTSLIIGKSFLHDDPREHGSKNPGSTNSARIWGLKIGLIVLTGDILKAVIPFWAIWAIASFTPLNGIITHDSLICSIWTVPLGSVLGHCYSPFLKFNGGKGVATYVGAFGSTSITQLVLGALTFFAVALKKKIVSLSSIILCCSATIISWVMFVLIYFGYGNVVGWMMFFNLLEINYLYPVVVTICSVLVIVRHSANIKRLQEGTEKEISFKK